MGSKNTAAAPQTGGFRVINWDGVKLDGTDFGGGSNTTVINMGKTVGIPLNRFQVQGTFFEEVYAVSSDGFTDVNPNVTGLFPAFSPSNTFAMFNDNTIDQSFVLPSADWHHASPRRHAGLRRDLHQQRGRGHLQHRVLPWLRSLGKFFVARRYQGQPSSWACCSTTRS